MNPETNAADVKGGASDPYATPADFEAWERLTDKLFIRKGSKDKTLHRIANVFPEFDPGLALTQPDADAYHGNFFVEKVRRGVVRQAGASEEKMLVIGSFNVRAEKFLAEFEVTSAD